MKNRENLIREYIETKNKLLLKGLSEDDLRKIISIISPKGTSNSVKAAGVSFLKQYIQ